MTKTQLIVVGSAVILLFVLYFGCETKPRDIQEVEKLRALATESTDVRVLMEEARNNLTPIEDSEVIALEQQLENIEADSLRTDLLKQLSGKWYELGHPAVAGYYAQEVAEIESTEGSWSIAGTTYTICLQNSQQDKIRAYCTQRAIQAFESAISLNPENIANQVNLALVYTENPPADNPMRGVKMLLDLNEENPENVTILNTLGRLAIKTGQYDNALKRLEMAISLQPDNRNTICLLAKAYEQAGKPAEASAFGKRCSKLNN